MMAASGSVRFVAEANEESGYNEQLIELAVRLIEDGHYDVAVVVTQVVMELSVERRPHAGLVQAPRVLKLRTRFSRNAEARDGRGRCSRAHQANALHLRGVRRSRGRAAPERGRDLSPPIGGDRGPSPGPPDAGCTRPGGG